MVYQVSSNTKKNCKKKYSWEAAPGPVEFFLILWKKKLRFLWFLMIIWVILGGFRSWTFFDWSVCFWVTGQIIWEKVIFCDFDPICIFLTIDFCENLQEHFFVWNQFLFIKTIRKNAKIFYKFNILAFFFISLVWLMTLAKILNL